MAHTVFGHIVGYEECDLLLHHSNQHRTEVTKVFHPLLALIASAADKELAKYVQYLKEENSILRARVPGQFHTKPAERERLLRFGKPVGRAIEELMTVVSPKTFYRWVFEEGRDSRHKNPKGGQRKPREIRELVLKIATTTGFGYTRIVGELRNWESTNQPSDCEEHLKEVGIEPASPGWKPGTFAARSRACVLVTKAEAVGLEHINEPRSPPAFEAGPHPAG